MDYARFDSLAVGRRLYAGEITLFHIAGYRAQGPVLRPALAPVWDLRRSWPMRHAAEDGWLRRACFAALGRALPPPA